MSDAVVNYNIEYAHLYAYEIARGVTDTLRRSALRTSRIVEELESRGATYTLCVLVDDYSSTDPVDPDRVLDLVEEAGLRPHVVCYEGDMAECARDLLEALPDRNIVRADQGVRVTAGVPESILMWPEPPPGESEELTSEELRVVPLTRLRSTRAYSNLEVILETVDSEGDIRWSCPALAACWNLARLGIEPFEEGLVTRHGLGPRPFIGERLITVLPTEYMKVESTAMEILSMCRPKPLRKARKRMSYIFYGQGFPAIP